MNLIKLKDTSMKNKLQIGQLFFLEVYNFVTRKNTKYYGILLNKRENANPSGSIWKVLYNGFATEIDTAAINFHIIE